MALTALIVSGATVASATPAVSEIPLEEGIVIDTTTGTVDDEATEVVEGTTDATTEEATANDGTSLPLDAGDVNATEPDTGGAVVEVAPAPTPQQDTVTLAEKETVVEEPKVEQLAQTGIADNGMLYAGVAAGVALLALVATKIFRTREA